MSFALPRYATRVASDFVILSDDTPVVWAFSFSGSSTFRLGWPAGGPGASAPLTGLSLLALPGLRPRNG